MSLSIRLWWKKLWWCRWVYVHSGVLTSNLPVQKCWTMPMPDPSPKTLCLPWNNFKSRSSSSKNVILSIGSPILGVCIPGIKLYLFLKKDSPMTNTQSRQSHWLSKNRQPRIYWLQRIPFRVQQQKVSIQNTQRNWMCVFLNIKMKWEMTSIILKLFLLRLS
jgi:hypothetical protein